MGKLFGTDGVRGIANTELSADLAFKIGRAAAFVMIKETSRSPKIIVGMDTRQSGPMLNAALSAGICSAGANVVNIGVIPTPAVAFLTRKYNADAGVVISASHNPMEYNGIKIFNSEGYKLHDSLENQIEEIIFENREMPYPIASEVGTIENKSDAAADYADYLTGIFPYPFLSGLKIALDCANGATYMVGPAVMKKLGGDVRIIHNAPDGRNINAACGSTHMENLAAYVKSNNIDVGIAFDGDGDRCLMVDEKGSMVDGDQIMSICATYMKEKGKLKGNALVATVMSNLGLFIMCEESGINIEKTSVGDRYVLERMLEINASLGGEQSGHIIFSDYNTTGDGILTAINLLSVLAESKKSLSELNTKMRVLPQILLNARVKNENKASFNKIDEIKKQITELEEKFAGRGRVLIRASGTEPLIRVMIEGEDTGLINNEAKKMVSLIEKYLN